MTQQLGLSENPVTALPAGIRYALREMRDEWRHILRYLLETEVHVYAFSISANVLLSFFPFLLVMVAICRHILHWQAAELSIYVAIKDYFPGMTGSFLAYNLHEASRYSRTLEWVSVLLLLFAANGVFLPLEVALNRAWGITKNRSLLKNQLVSTGLIFACGGLATVSVMMTGGAQVMWSSITGQGLQTLEAHLTERFQPTQVPFLIASLSKLATVPVTILILFLIYSYLPNTKVPKRLVMPRAILVGICLEGMKGINVVIWPWLLKKLDREYGPFQNTVTIIMWSFFAALIVLAGADWSARMARRQQAVAESQAALPAPGASAP
jgi:membrane protein